MKNILEIGMVVYSGGKIKIEDGDGIKLNNWAREGILLT